MRQRAFTLVKPIVPGREADVRASLLQRGDEVQDGRDDRFRGVPGLHFLSCCIVEKSKTESELVVELSHDGSTHGLLQWVVAERRAALDEILGGCRGYPGAGAPCGQIIEYLTANVRPQALYLGTPGRGLGQIHEERNLRARIGDELECTRELALTRAERWERVAKAIYAQSPDLQVRCKRPLRTYLSPLAPGFRVQVLGGARLLALALAWLAGVACAAYWARETWHWLVVAGIPLALGLAAAGLFVLESPRALRPVARLRVLGQAQRELVGTALWLVPLGGFVVGGVELPLDRVALITALSLLASAALALATTLALAALLFTLAGRLAAVGVALAALAVSAWRFATFPSHERLLLETSLAALAVGALWIVLGIGFAIAIRKREIDGTPWNGDDDAQHIEKVMRREYQQFQSHLASVTHIDVGPLRMWTLRAVLRWIGLLAWYWFNQGHLDRISSIHFARFIILPGRRLLFLSNYDDRFDDYLGEFSSVAGVTAIWGNAAGFPRPFLLIHDGARNESLFKRYARRSQVESLVWYSAYPELSVDQINHASRLREALSRPIDRGERGFLASVCRCWRPPLDELALVELMDGR